MTKRTIIQSIVQVLKQEEKPLTPKEIYDLIVEQDLYQFKAQKPVHIVLTTIRRSLVNHEISGSRKKKRYFVLLKDGRYWLKDEPVKGNKKLNPKELYETNIPSKETLLKAHQKYTNEFRGIIRKYLKGLTPEKFEIFGKNLLDVYGFEKMKVTPKGRDGGIDGFGVLKVGTGYIRVAFQCKRWRSAKVNDSEVHAFRSKIQPKYHQGIFFTTNYFTQPAKKINDDGGMIPIILMDIEAIIDLMIEKEFGVQVERKLPMYLPALEEIDDLLNETD